MSSGTGCHSSWSAGSAADRMSRMARSRRIPHTLAFALLAAGGCQYQQTAGELPATPEVVASTTRYRREYLIAPGDTFDLFVRNHATLSRTCVVRPDGFVTVPLLDDVPAAGRTFAELDEDITKRLAGRILEPEVSVIATQVRQDEVFVFGEVASPSVVPLRRAVTAAQAVAQAGGFKDSASRDMVSVIRLDGDGIIRALPVAVDLPGQPAELMALQNFPLRSGDIVFIPKSDLAQFNLYMRQLITEPLTGVNSVVATYANYRLIQVLE